MEGRKRMKEKYIWIDGRIGNGRKRERWRSKRMKKENEGELWQAICWKIIWRNIELHGESQPITAQLCSIHWWIREFGLIFLKNTPNLSSVTKSNPIPLPNVLVSNHIFAWSISTQLILLSQLENWLMCVKASRPGKRLQPEHESQFVKQDKDSLTVGPETGSAMNSMGVWRQDRNTKHQMVKHDEYR